MDLISALSKIGITEKEIQDQLLSIKVLNSKSHKELKGTSSTLSTIMASLLNTVIVESNIENMNVPYDNTYLYKEDDPISPPLLNDDIILQFDCLPYDYLFS